MKKLLSVLMAMVIVMSVSCGALAVSDKGNGSAVKGDKPEQKSTVQTEFKNELKDQKKEAIENRNSLEQQKEELQVKYDALIAAGDTSGAEALKTSISDLDAKIAEAGAKIKEINNERFMLAKTMYTDEELAKFESATALIEQMYKDAKALDAGSVVIKNNIIKFDAPPYIKGGKTIVPLRAITEGLGAEVTYNAENHTVTVTKDGKVVVLTLGSSKVTVDGAEVDAGASAEITCSRTFVPLRFLAETFGLKVTWDGESDTIDIDDTSDTASGTASDTTSTSGDTAIGSTASNNTLATN